MSNATRRSGATRSTTGSCTANCSALPTTEPHASSTASRGSAEPAAPHQQRGDHRRVPHHGRRIRQHELVVAVQHTEAPRGHDQHAGARKQDARERDREFALLRR